MVSEFFILNFSWIIIQTYNALWKWSESSSLKRYVIYTLENWLKLKIIELKVTFDECAQIRRGFFFFRDARTFVLSSDEVSRCID